MQYINPFFQLYARDGVYAEKAGAFFCQLLNFEHGCSYIEEAGAQEREVKTLQTFVKNLDVPCSVIVFVKGIAINCKRCLAEHAEIVHKNSSNCGF